MNDFGVHTCNLFFHLGDFLFSWTDVSFEFLDFVIEDKLKFLEFLSFFLQFVDSHHFVSDGFFSFLNFFGLRDFFL
jgi:hypothetical protein